MTYRALYWCCVVMVVLKCLFVNCVLQCEQLMSLVSVVCAMSCFCGLVKCCAMFTPMSGTVIV